MLLRFLFVSLSLLFLPVYSEGYTCADYLVNPDLNEPYYFPNNWNESMPPAKYNPSQNCNWQINVLEDMYATVTFYKDSNKAGSFDVYYPDKVTVAIHDDDINPYIFTYQQFRVNMFVQNQPGAFSFKVVWSNYPNACSKTIPLNDSPVPNVPDTCFTTYTAPNNVMLVGFPTKEDSDDALRQSAVFDGGDYRGEYLGNLYDLLNTQIVSKSNQLTVYTFGLSEKYNYTLYMGVDTKAIGDVQRFRGLRCKPSVSPCLIYLPSSAISAVATVSDDVDYLAAFDKFPYEGTLKIYEGKMAEDNLLTTVNRTDYPYKFPMAVKNNVKIYYLDQGTVQIPLSTQTRSYWTTVFPNRIVNIHSFYYRELSPYQYTFETFTTSRKDIKMHFNLNVKRFDVNGPTKLDIQVLQDGYVVFSQRYTGVNPPPTDTLRLFGDAIAFIYDTDGYSTKGFEIEMICKDSGLTTTTTSYPTVPTQKTNPTLRTVATTVTTKNPTSSSISPIPTTTTTTTTSTTTTTTTSTTTVPTTTKFSNGAQLSYFVLVIFLRLIF